ncbi:MAG: thioredoxin family protein [Ardenticatenaceae bacterium]|nr:thioredoxin family protein [Ardenticatenaceae bacterium]
MRLDFRRNDSHVGIVLVTGSCCIPGMAPFDEHARRIVEQAIAETGVTVQVKVMPATTAYMGGIPKKVIAQLINAFNQSGQMSLPAVLVNGELIAAGVPQLEDIKSALLRLAGEKETREIIDG